MTGNHAGKGEDKAATKINKRRVYEGERGGGATHHQKHDAPGSRASTTKHNLPTCVYVEVPIGVSWVEGAATKFKDTLESPRMRPRPSPLVVPMTTWNTAVTLTTGGRKDSAPRRTRVISEMYQDGVVPITTAESDVARFKSPASLSRLLITSLV
jgi:hypothetical protein